MDLLNPTEKLIDLPFLRRSPSDLLLFDYFIETHIHVE